MSYYGKEEKNNLTPSSLPKWVKQFNNTGSFKEKDNLTEEQKELIELRKRNKHGSIITGFMVDKEGSELLLNLISIRNETKSTIITSNLTFDRWDEVFNDPVLTAAMVDRLTHRSYIINMSGSSYRMKETSE